MNIHTASLFDYKKYRAEIQDFVEQVDRKDYRHFQDHLIGLVSEIQRVWPSDLAIPYDPESLSDLVQIWPLFAHEFDVIPNEKDIRKKDPSNADIGFWFFISLSGYILPCTSPSGNWKVLFDILLQVGWSQTDCELLFKGHPTSMLLKPLIGNKSPWPLENADPYWLWMHPGRARAGWLPHEDLTLFRRMLSDSEEKIMNFDLQRLPDICTDNPVVIKEYSDFLYKGYISTIQMLDVGILNGRGLFMSISVM